MIQWVLVSENVNIHTSSHPQISWSSLPTAFTFLLSLFCKIFLLFRCIFSPVRPGPNYIAFHRLRLNICPSLNDFIDDSIAAIES